MGRYEEALDICDSAVESREGSDYVSKASKKEAYLIRGEALLLDMDYDEAVQDFRAAFELVPEDEEHMQERRELHYKLQQTTIFPNTRVDKMATKPFSITLQLTQFRNEQ